VAAPHFDFFVSSWVNAMGKERTGSLRQPGLPKCRQQPFVILVAREPQHKAWHYVADAQVRLLGEAMLHRPTRLVRFPQGRCRRRQMIALCMCGCDRATLLLSCRATS
jgi:hypothetical protein